MHVIYQLLFDLLWLSRPYQPMHSHKEPHETQGLKRAIEHAIEHKIVHKDKWHEKTFRIM